MSKSNPNIHTPPHGHAGPASGAPIHYGTAGLPVGYDERSVLKTAMSKSKCVPCFGGKLFYAKDYLNNALICHAIQCTNMEHIQTLSKWYHITRRISNVAFLPYEHSINLGGGTVVYTFAIHKNYTSMRQLMEREDRQKYCATLFRKLVDLLWSYRQEIGKHYAALLSISLDTVFMDSAGRLHLLPLLCTDNQFPKGYPLEAGTDEADDRTDLYTAALLALQVASGCEYESRAENKRMNPDLVHQEVMRCLCVFPSGRHNLTQVRNIMSAAQTVEEESHGKKGKPKTPAGDPIPSGGKHHFHGKDPVKEKEPDVYDEDQEEVPSFFGTMIDLLKKARHIVAAPADQVSSTSDFPEEDPPKRSASGSPKKPAKEAQHHYYGFMDEEDDCDDEGDDSGDDGWDVPFSPSTQHYHSAPANDDDHYDSDGDEVDFGDEF